MHTVDMKQRDLTPEALAALELMRQVVDKKVDEHKKLDLEGALNDQERRFVEAYVESCDKKAAGEAASFHQPGRLMKDPVVQLAIQRGMDEASEGSKLRAEYVREYIYDVLELCPTDHFFCMPNGEWCILPEHFYQLPHKVKRLVESVEQRTLPRGEKMFKVEFISKRAALAMAAKYTLVEQHAVQFKQVPWEELLNAEAEAQKTIEMKLAELREEPKGVKDLSDEELLAKLGGK